MPRQPRVHIDRGLYYVSSSGVGAQKVFVLPEDYETYLQLLKEYKSQFGFGLYAYALLPNSLHLCIEVSQGTTISAIMHALNSRYTKYFNGRLGRKGHVFKGRFRSVLVEKSHCLHDLIRYIHTLPVQAASQLQPVGGCHSSFPLYASGQSGVVPAKYPNMGKEIAEGHRQLSLRDSAGQPHDCWVYPAASPDMLRIEQELGGGIFGSEGFVRKMEAQIARGTQKKQSSEKTFVSVRRLLLPVALCLALAFLLLSTTNLSGPENQNLAHRSPESLAQVSVVEQGATDVRKEEAELKAEIRQEFAKLLRQTSVGEVRSLNGTAWQVRLIPASGSGSEIQDNLRFEEGRVLSGLLASQGFPQSNYSLTVQEDGKVVWETMQTNPSGEVASWRGEWTGEQMQGVFSRQRAGNLSQDYYFVAVQPSTAGQRPNTSEI